MKEKRKITGIITFIGGLGWGLFGLFIISTEEIRKTEAFFALLSLMVSAISAILYVVWTDFGKKEQNELEKIEYENEVLKKRIEQQELKKKLG